MLKEAMQCRSVGYGKMAAKQAILSLSIGPGEFITKG
jgi:hypothetical protein